MYIIQAVATSVGARSVVILSKAWYSETMHTGTPVGM